jgi:hypothetical protein
MGEHLQVCRFDKSLVKVLSSPRKYSVFQYFGVFVKYQTFRACPFAVDVVTLALGDSDNTFQRPIPV